MRILHATDGEQAARDAAGLLARIGRRSARITVVSVNSFDVALKEAASFGHYSSERGHAHAARIVDDAVVELRDAGFDPDGVVVDGDATTEILRLAETSEADLIVLGAGKTRWADALILGSVSSSVLHAASCSVLVVHRLREAGRPHALVSTDGSEGAGRAREVFTELVDPKMCHVTAMMVAKHGGMPDDAGASASEALGSARAEAGACAADLEASGYRTDVRVAAGHPARLLLEAAAEGNVDLVVAGARGLGRVRAAVLGSTSDTLVRQAPATLVGR